ncbi:unnamed protein product [Trichogramma brassicae]|uniref:Uncharacterized protein n=1 Tax=Trichogramma brassicae TaxID=86971 RepID=A0A6H5IMP1_9HYME|nr:unnamed protein product [Trichogramma brassicae]
MVKGGVRGDGSGLRSVRLGTPGLSIDVCPCGLCSPSFTAVAMPRLACAFGVRDTSHGHLSLNPKVPRMRIEDFKCFPRIRALKFYNYALPAANLQLENNTEITLTLLQEEIATLKRQQQLQQQPFQEQQKQQQPQQQALPQNVQQPCPAQVLQQQQPPQLQPVLMQSQLAQNDQHVHAQQATSQGQQQQSQQLVQLQLQMQQQEQQLQQQQALRAALMQLQLLPSVAAQMNVSNQNPLELPAPLTPNSSASVEEPKENEK